MLIFLAAIAVALVLRRVLPARAHANVRLRWPLLPLAALLLQVVLNLGGVRAAVGGGRFDLVVLSYAIVGAWLIGNTIIQAPTLRVPAAVVSAGWLLNTLPILANHGMPVSGAALRRIGLGISKVSDGNLWKHVLSGPHTLLPWLGDVIAVPVPVLRNVISVGDLCMALGVMLAIQFVSFGARTEASRREGPLIVEAPSPP